MAGKASEKIVRGEGSIGPCFLGLESLWTVLGESRGLLMLNENGTEVGDDIFYDMFFFL